MSPARRGQRILGWVAVTVSAAIASLWAVCYNGAVRPRPKRVRWAYLSFRAVKAPGDDTISGRP